MATPTLAIISTVLMPALMTAAPTAGGARAPAAAQSERTEALVYRVPAAQTDAKIQADTGAGPLLTLRDKIAEFACLVPGWDGDQASAPSDECVRAAERFIDRLPGGLPLPGTMLSTSGEIGFYWDLNGGYADISFSPSGEGSFFSRTTTGAEEYIDELSVETIDRDWFFAHLGALAAPVRTAA